MQLVMKEKSCICHQMIGFTIERKTSARNKCLNMHSLKDI